MKLVRVHAEDHGEAARPQALLHLVVTGREHRLDLLERGVGKVGVRSLPPFHELFT